MKRFSKTLCAVTLFIGASTSAQAIEFSSQSIPHTALDMDQVLNQLYSHKSTTQTNLFQSTSDPTSLSKHSLLVDMSPNAVDLNSGVQNEDMFSHLTLVASNSVDKFKQTGRASWYGGKLHGRRTASGERFNMHAMTAAHPTLPFNSYVKVTNKSNGKSVVVKINDRGPFVGNRIIDLSYASAKKIGLVSRGVGNVSLVKVSAP